MFYLFFLGVISRIASSASIAINTKGISITNNGPVGLASKVFNESDLVITRDLNGTTHPHLSQSIGIVISSNLQTTKLKLVQKENDTYHNVYLSVTIPTNKLRKLNYISDRYAFQNRNKVFVSATLQRQWMGLIDDMISAYEQNQSTSILKDIKLICTCAFRDFGIVVFELNEHGTFISIINAIIKQYNDMRAVYGVINERDIVLIKKLKQQNSSDKQLLATKMSNEIGVIMPWVSTKNTRNQTVFGIQSVRRSHRVIKLRRKWFRKMTKIYLYPVSPNPSAHDLLSIRKEMMKVLSNQSNDVMNLISQKLSCQILGTNTYAATNLMYLDLPIHLLAVIEKVHRFYNNDTQTVPAVIEMLSLMHFVVDKDAFAEAMEQLSRIMPTDDAVDWMVKMQLVYDTNYIRFGTNYKRFDVKTAQSEALAKAVFACDLIQMNSTLLWRPLWKYMWNYFWNILRNICQDRFRNIAVHRLGMSKNTIGNVSVDSAMRRVVYSDTLRNYELSNKLGRDLHVFYERSTLGNDTPFKSDQFQRLLALKLKVEWNIDFTKANILAHHLVQIKIHLDISFYN
eukprot:850681_1